MENFVPHESDLQVSPHGKIEAVSISANWSSVIKAHLVKFKLLSKSARLPYRATPRSAGFDCMADLEAMGAPAAVIPPGQMMLINLGFAFEPPAGFAGFLLPRSGLGTKKGMVLANTVGLIDEDYRDPLMAAVKNTSDKSFMIEHGERICQLVLVPVFMGDALQVDELSTTDRAGGFGSTGTK